MTSDPSCIFCKIIAGELPASVVAEDEMTIAFMDISPLTPGHLLVVPREHHARIANVPGETMSRIMMAGQQLAGALRASPVKTEGINLFLADGAAAGQEVMHAHLHVIPRWQGDGFRMSRSNWLSPSREELNDTAAAIRAATE